jgi:hypothetical protein
MLKLSTKISTTHRNVVQQNFVITPPIPNHFPSLFETTTALIL